MAIERRKSEQITGVLHQFLRSSGLETPYLQYKLVQAWPEVVGKDIALHSQALEVRNQTLWVHVELPALRTQLSMMRQQLIQQLNAAVKATLIYDIRWV